MAAVNGQERVRLAPVAHSGPAPRRFGRLIAEHLRERCGGGIARVRCGRNLALYSCGQRDASVYLIESGWIKTLALSTSGKECLLGIYGCGDVVGELCLVEEERSSMAVAMVASVLTRVSRQRFLEILGDGGILDDWMRYLAFRLVEQQQVIASMVTADSERRLAVTLLRLGHKLGTAQADQFRIEHRITQEELAGMVGTTRSRVGHFLKEFRRGGLIAATPDSRLVIHERRLRRYVEMHL